MVELLAPAGDMACFEAAISAGADAVYVGGDKFGARAYAKNFDRDELVQLLKKAHLFDKKVYLTINTLMKEAELSELVTFLAPYYEEGLDGVIVQDFGALSLIRESFPDLPLHASTQMTITGEMGAGLLKKFGVSRVVPARELSLDEIVRIKENTGLEIETFIHGAMCYSYSGQCLFSSMLGPRSGNRGRCAGPCRLPYRTFFEGRELNNNNERYQLSLKDLCVLEILPKLLEAGIDSFKIEGRMKTPEYVAFVTGMYRKYIDFYYENPKEYSVSEEDMIRLQNNFSRGSVQSGYYFKHNGRELVTLNKPGYQSFDKVEEKNSISTGELPLPQIDLIGHFIAKEGTGLKLKVETKKGTVEVTGNIPQTAQNRAATEADVEKQLKKTGNTPFRFAKITYELDDHLFLPNKELNELRREALYKVEGAILQDYRRSEVNPLKFLPTEEPAEEFGRRATGDCIKGYFHIFLENVSQLLAIHEDEHINAVFLSFDALSEIRSEVSKSEKKIQNKIQTLKDSGIEFYLRLPSVVRLKTVNLLKEYRTIIDCINPHGFSVNNLESLAYVREHYKDKFCVTDWGAYFFNPETAGFYEALGIYEHVLSCELHKKEIESILKAPECKKHTFILPVYGYVPVMESAGCLLKTNGCCKKERGDTLSKEVFLIDRHNKKLRVLTHCNRCENTIYNSVPLSLHKETEEIVKLPLAGVALRFTTETGEETAEIIKYFKKLYQDKCFSGQEGIITQEFTKGHFLKGVE